MKEEKPDRAPIHYFVGSLVDAIAPLIVYAVFHALGVTALLSMILCSSVALLSLVINSIRNRRFDSFGLFVLAEIAVGILLQFTLQDTRFLLIKPSLYSAIGAVYLLFTSFGDNPATYSGARPMATKGDPVRTAAYERTWKESPRFRALHRMATRGWAAGFFADAVLRVLIVYTVPMDHGAIWLAQVPHLTAIVLLIGFSALVGRMTQPLVEEQVRLITNIPASK